MTRRTDRWWYGAAFAVLLGACWGYLIFRGADMRRMAGMSLSGDEAWTLEYAASMFVMWAVMTVAMMLPSALPLLVVYRRLGAARGVSAAAVVLLAAGYLAMWLAFAVLATLAQWYLHQRALLSPAMAATNRVFAGTLLIAAGVYQWTPAKDACLGRCASPLQFLTTHWRGGLAGAWRMGLVHGAWCVGCCWLLMALLFVGGVMNLVWIVAIAAYILVEKMLPPNRWRTKGSGFGLVAAGMAIILT
jgi:predicted metal-binding membrane protein